MRILNALLAIMMIVLAWLAMNDPNASMWVFIYGLAAFFNIVAAAAPGAMTLKPLTMMLSLTTAGAILGLWAFWPDQAGWWSPAAWAEPGEARRAMGALVAALALFGPIVTSVRQGSIKRRAATRAKEEALEQRTQETLKKTRALAEASQAGPQPSTNRW